MRFNNLSSKSKPKKTRLFKFTISGATLVVFYVFRLAVFSFKFNFSFPTNFKDYYAFIKPFQEKLILFEALLLISRINKHRLTQIPVVFWWVKVCCIVVEINWTVFQFYSSSKSVCTPSHFEHIFLSFSWYCFHWDLWIDLPKITEEKKWIGSLFIILQKNEQNLSEKDLAKQISKSSRQLHLPSAKRTQMKKLRG